jgi:hypothetical protein
VHAGAARPNAGAAAAPPRRKRHQANSRQAQAFQRRTDGSMGPALLLQQDGMLPPSLQQQASHLLPRLQPGMQALQQMPQQQMPQHRHKVRPPPGCEPDAIKLFVGGLGLCCCCGAGCCHCAEGGLRAGAAKRLAPGLGACSWAACVAVRAACSEPGCSGPACLPWPWGMRLAGAQCPGQPAGAALTRRLGLAAAQVGNIPRHLEEPQLLPFLETAGELAAPAVFGR